ncbi:MAG TPA: hypothetical protein VF412_02860 [Bdellovibrio sp.]|uniref:hypothetical protein n=1 Tax=Bdellovibrio sp. TaxID=28201 RepID=UPI002F04EC4F
MELQKNTGLDLAPSFRADLEELSALLGEIGYKISPYKNAELKHFKKLSLEKQKEVAQYLEVYLQTLKAEYFGGNFSHEKFVIRFLFRLGLLPSEDMTESIRNEKYIQIYSRDQLQIFRSLACYERCSFTLEQMTTRPWYDLWERESLFYYACFGLATTALKIIKFTKLRLDFPHHRVTEVDTSESFTFDYKIKSLSALTRQNKLQAALLIEDWKY